MIDIGATSKPLAIKIYFNFIDIQCSKETPLVWDEILVRNNNCLFCVAEAFRYPFK